MYNLMTATMLGEICSCWKPPTIARYKYQILLCLGYFTLILNIVIWYTTGMLHLRVSSLFIFKVVVCGTSKQKIMPGWEKFECRTVMSLNFQFFRLLSLSKWLPTFRSISAPSSGSISQRKWSQISCLKLLAVGH
jgi:hypothetical protein